MRTLILVLFAGVFFVNEGFAQQSQAPGSGYVIVGGDVRFRHDYERQEQNGSYARNRQRVRAHVGITAEVSETVTAGVRIASGSSNPASTNQTLGTAFSTKSLNLDLAYILWDAAMLVPNLEIRAGKFKNPLFRPGKEQLLWDSDVNPEGGAFVWVPKLGNTSPFVALGDFVLQENRTTSEVHIAVFQAGVNVKFAGDTRVTLGGGYYPMFNISGTALLDPGATTASAYGNSSSGGNYTQDYRPMEAFIEAEMYFGRAPTKIFGNYVTNSKVDSEGKGWLAGVQFGRAKVPGEYAISYSYRKLEKDAVLGLFTDSDFAGGGTDVKGHKVSGSLALAAYAKVGVSYFQTKNAVSTTNDPFKKILADIQLTF